MNVNEYTKRELNKIYKNISSLPINNNWDKVKEWADNRKVPLHILLELKQICKYLIDTYEVNYIGLYGSYFNGTWYDETSLAKDLQIRQLIFNNIKASKFSDIDLIVDKKIDSQIINNKFIQFSFNSVSEHLLLYRESKYYI